MVSARRPARNNSMEAHQEESDNENPQRTPHYLAQEVDLSQYNSGLKLIPEFNGKNWEMFKRKLETQFTIMGLETYLVHAPTQENRWEIRNDRLASAQIHLRLPEAQFKQVSSCKTTNETWSTLSQIYEMTAESKAANLFVQFLHIEKRNSQKMKSYLDKLVELYHDLRIYNIEITELGLCAKALDGLPERYAQIKAAARATQVSTIPTLTNILLSAENEEQTSTPDIDIKSLNTEIKSLKSKMKTYGKRKYCKKCRRTGHDIEECWKVHPHLKRDNKRPHTFTNSTTNDVETHNDDVQFTGYHTWSSRQSSANDFLVDCGANVSMTNNKSILSDYQESETQTSVTSSNGGKSRVYGHGHLKLRDNPKIEIRHVLYVPTITKTL